MAKLRIRALEMAARIGRNTIIVVPPTIEHVTHSFSPSPISIRF
jgi:hypothetical protein